MSIEETVYFAMDDEDSEEYEELSGGYEEEKSYGMEFEEEEEELPEIPVPSETPRIFREPEPRKEIKPVPVAAPPPPKPAPVP